MQNSLDSLLTESEIWKAIKKLKNGKASYDDKIRNEMIKASTPEIIYVLEILFDLVFITWCFPPIWCEGMITLIFKSSKKKDPNYYRSICVSSWLGKLFCTILNDRILNYTTENDIIHPS